MRITALPTRTTTPARAASPTPPPAPAAEQDSSTVATVLSLAGGAVSLVGGLTHNSLLTAAGMGAFAVGSGMHAYRIGREPMDSQATLALVGGGAMACSGALLLFALPTPPPAHEGPLPQLLKNPAIANIFKALG
ncbi:MAG: hypothetical protein AB7S38_01190 [Vulcanimicrobiota bacterium]